MNGRRSRPCTRVVAAAFALAVAVPSPAGGCSCADPIWAVSLEDVSVNGRPVEGEPMGPPRGGWLIHHPDGRIDLAVGHPDSVFVELRFSR